MSAGCILLSAYVVSGVSINNFRTDKQKRALDEAMGMEELTEMECRREE